MCVEADQNSREIASTAKTRKLVAVVEKRCLEAVVIIASGLMFPGLKRTNLLRSIG